VGFLAEDQRPYSVCCVKEPQLCAEWLCRASEHLEFGGFANNVPSAQIIPPGVPEDRKRIAGGPVMAESLDLL
jgi:hypothetical protein